MDPFSCCLAFCNGSACLVAEATNKVTHEGFWRPFILNVVLCCLGGALNRAKIRERYSIEGNFVGDCLVMACCGPCAAAQAWREVKARDYATLN